MRFPESRHHVFKTLHRVAKDFVDGGDGKLRSGFDRPGLEDSFEIGWGSSILKGKEV